MGLLLHSTQNKIGSLRFTKLFFATGIVKEEKYMKRICTGYLYTSHSTLQYNDAYVLQTDEPSHRGMSEKTRESKQQHQSAMPS